MVEVVKNVAHNLKCNHNGGKESEAQDDTSRRRRRWREERDVEGKGKSAVLSTAAEESGRNRHHTEARSGEGEYIPRGTRTAPEGGASAISFPSSPMNKERMREAAYFDSSAHNLPSPQPLVVRYPLSLCHMSCVIKTRSWGHQSYKL